MTVRLQPQPSHPAIPLDRPVPPRAVLVAFAVWTGLLTGLGELVYLAAKKFGRGLFVFRGPEVLWMTPLATALLFGLAGVLLVALLRAPGALTWRRAATVYLALAAMSLLFLLPPLHKGASVVLSLGFGYQAARMLARWEPGLTRLMRRTLPPLLALVLVTGLAVAGLRAWRERGAMRAIPAAVRGAPNVLLLVLDTVRALNLSVYGYGRPTSPTLERLAARGVRFDRAVSTAPWTLPSHASLFTGTWPHQQTTDWFAPLDRDTPTLAGLLAAHGYRTGGFVANVWYCGRETGLARGFARYEDHRVTPGTFATSASLVRTIVEHKLVRRAAGTDQLIGRKHAADINRAFLDWLRKDETATRPFFAFLNYYDAHTPYLPPEGFVERYRSPGVALVPNLERHGRKDGSWTAEQIQGAMDAYDGAITYLDREIGRLLDTLEARGLLENTLVVVTSDHGEEFNEHGLIHHGNSLYFPSVHIPLLLSLPGRVPEGAVVPGAVSLRQVPATILDLIGADPGAVPGESLVRLWEDSARAEASPVVAELKYAPLQPEWYPASKGDMASVLRDPLRYIVTGDGAEQLYDLSQDPLERQDLSRSPGHAGELAELRALFDSIQPMRRTR